MSLIATLALVFAQADTTIDADIPSYVVESMPAADVIDIPGTKVALPQPPGFVLSDSFSGLMCPELGASIVVTEMPAGYGEVAFALEAPSLEAQGLEPLANEDAIIGGREGRVVHVRQEHDGNTFEKWIAVGGNEEASIMLTATYPEQIAKDVSSAMRNTILAARWDPQLELPPFSGMPFELELAGEFDVATRMQGNVILTKSGELPQQPSEEPVFITAYGDLTTPAADRAQYSRDRLNAMEGLLDVTERSFEELVLDGVPATIVAADAKEAQSGKPIIFYQALVFDEARLYVLQGFVPQDGSGEILESFRQMTRSFTRQEG